MPSRANNSSPAVSVLLPVYTAETYLGEAIQSILNQTFSDFEFIIIDDGSTDGSAAIMDSFDDPRIIRVKNELNIGLMKTLNKAIGMARGEYIVRVDADDISLPNRLEKQVDFMHNNPQISISGTTPQPFPCSVAGVHCGMLSSNSIAPSTSIMRTKDIIAQNLAFTEEYRYENEYDFYTRAIMAGLKISNIPEPLLKKRTDPSQIDIYFEKRVRDVEMMQIQKRYCSYLLRHLKFIDPRYLYCMSLFFWSRCSKKLAHLYKKMYLKKKEFDFYRVPFEDCPHINCDALKLKDGRVLDIATVAFNNPEVIGWQIALLRKNLQDTFLYTVFDNSNDEQKSSEIRELCASERTAYVKLPKNHLTRSSSHGSSLNWIYKNYFIKRGADYFGFIDHDIFPVKETSLLPILSTQPIYGHLQERGTLWYLWAGFCFFRSNVVSGKLNFLDGKIRGTSVDTGGMNWGPLYSKLDKEKISFPVSRYEKLRKSKNPTLTGYDMSLDNVEHIGDWVHIFSASGWKKIEGQNERDEKIRSMISNFLLK